MKRRPNLGGLNIPDFTFSIADAERLAERLRNFWAKKGHVVRVWIWTEAGSLRGVGKPIFCVRSNLVNGLSRKIP